jgi:DNA polymerase-3 subunit epsilon
MLSCARMPLGRSAQGPLVGAEQEPTTLTARAARRLALGPLDPVTLMRDVCRVERLQRDAAERMAVALLGPRREFAQLPDGCWMLRDDSNGPPIQPGTVKETAVADHALTDLSFAVVDVETTGMQAAGSDRITEIAIVRVRGGEIADVYARLVNPQRTIPPVITALTNISWEMVKNEPPFATIADDVLQRLTGHVFTAHNAAFDWRFVSEEISRASRRALYGHRLCTVRMTRSFLPQLTRRSLDHVTHYLGIPVAARHRAEGDAVATAQVLLRLLRIAEDHGITTLATLLSHVRAPAAARSRTASDRRRRAFPLPSAEDDVA